MACVRPCVGVLMVPIVVALVFGCGSDRPTSDSASPAPSIRTGSASPSADAPSDESGFIMAVQKEPFGTTADGHEIDRYLLTNDHGMKVSIITFGAVVTGVEVPDRVGRFANVTLGFDDLSGYERNAPYFGALCGRYANRIAGGKFTLNGTEYALATNDAPNHLHGGIKGFHKVVWQAEAVETDESVGVRLRYVSPDGDEGYPGTLVATIVYTLTNENELKIEYTATADKPTPLNLTSHCYWNLAGAGSPDVLNHTLTLHCDQYLPVDDTLIPTGELRDVHGTPLDFTAPTTIGARIEAVGGYDHCFVINGEADTLRPAAKVSEPNSGRVMQVFTTEPGVQLYTGNHLDGTKATGGFDRYAGFCLECQHFPDSPNHPQFPDTILKPGEAYKQTTIYKFSVTESKSGEQRAETPSRVQG